MQQKLIITLWKAQFKQLDKQSMISCRLIYNNQQKISKTSSHAKNMAWKETFVFLLSKKQIPLRVQFLSLKDGQQIHFAKDTVLDSLSIGKSSVNIEINSTYRGSMPCKLDIFDEKEQNIGKLFIQYELLKTEIVYTVQKQLDYIYSLKMSNFQVTFVRNLKKSPKFYLHCNIEDRVHKQQMPFQLQKNVWVYNYPVRLYLKKQMQLQVELHLREQQQYEIEVNENNTESSFNMSKTTPEEKSLKSSVGKKQKISLQLGKQKISGVFDLNFKKDCKVTKKVPLSTLIRYQKRQIGSIQFHVQVVFRSKQELLELQQQKKWFNPQIDKSLQKKKGDVKPKNGIITVNSILGKLEPFNQSIIQKRNMSIDVKLGKNPQQSTILQTPGKQLIIIDTFVFKRTWQQTMKFIINLYNDANQKFPTFFSQVNLRELFEIGRYVSKKIKIKDQYKNYAGQLILDMNYKQVQQKKPSPVHHSLKQEQTSLLSSQQSLQLKKQSKRIQIQERIKKRQEQKERSKQIYSMSTLAVLQDNQIILPPLKSSSRLQTISPNRAQKFNKVLINKSGDVKFNKAARFQSAQKPGYQSFTYVRESDFKSNQKKGPYIGYGQKHDFVKPYVKNPGVGRYEFPSVFDKYK